MTLFALLVAGMTFTSCSDSYMNGLNTDDSKATSIEPSAQLTTALLQTYGDFGFMDTYRSYITGFTQHFAGGWNVSNYGGSVYAKDEEEREAALQAICTIEGMKFAFKWLMNEDSCDQLNDILNR